MTAECQNSARGFVEKFTLENFDKSKDFYIIQFYLFFFSIFVYFYRV